MSRGPNILAIETSGRVGGVALARGAQLLCSAYFQTSQNHAVELLPTAERLCHQQGWSPHELDEVFVSIGPGSFTGLRIAVTVARALALSLGVRIVAVPTLEVIAQNALQAPARTEQVAVILDAKRKQIYGGAFGLSGDRYRASAAPCVSEPASFLSRLSQPLTLLGEGIHYHEPAIAGVPHRRLDESLWTPRVEVVVQLGLEKSSGRDFVTPAALQPLYLRRPEAEDVWRQRHGTRERRDDAAG